MLVFLILHLIIRVVEVSIVLLVLVFTELLGSLGEVDVLATSAASDDVVGVDLGHCVLVLGLCSDCQYLGQTRLHLIGLGDRTLDSLRQIS